MAPDRPGFDREGVTADFSAASMSGPDAPTPDFPRTDDSLPRSFGRYAVRGYLGKGGFGAVYLGYDDQLDRHVAIKVPKQDFSEKAAQNFLQEARRIAKLRHPGIVSIFDFGVQDTSIYLITD